MGKKIKKATLVSVLVTVFLLFYVGVILISNYRSQAELQETILRQFTLENQRLALVLSNFFYNRSEDLMNLKTARSLDVFFENKALGMSMEYGLRQSIPPIKKRFFELLDRYKAENRYLFLRIVFLDENGGILAEVYPPLSSPQLLENAQEFLSPGQSKPAYLVKNGGKEIIISDAYYFKGKYAGQIVAWLHPESLRAQTMLDSPSSHRLSFLTLKNGNIPLTARMSALPDIAILKTDVPQTFRISNEQEGKHNVIGVRSAIHGTPFSLVTVASEEELSGGLKPKRLLIGMGVFALLIMGGAIVAYRTTMNSLVLEARLDEAQLHAKEILGKNIQLEGEIAERTKAENALKERGLLMGRYNQVLVDLAKKESLYKGDLSEAFRAINEASAAALDVRRTSVWFNTADDTGIRCMDLYDRETKLHSDCAELRVDSYPAYLSALKEENVIDAHHALTDARTKDFSESYLIPHGISSLLDVPVRVQGEIVGVVRHEHVGPARTWSLEEKSFVTAVAGFVIIAIEAYERNQAETALKHSEERFRELADALPQTVFECDAAGNLHYCNITALALFGYTKEEVDGGFSVLQLLAPEDRLRAWENIQTMLQGEKVEHQEYTALRKDGTTLPVVIHAGPIIRDSEPVGLRGMLIDISDQKRFEAEVLKRQKLESIGILAGGIAHDFNNFLMAILGSISLARMRLTPDDTLNRLLGEAEKASLRAKDLTHQLLTFSKGGAPIKKTICLEPLIRDTASFALRGANVNINVRAAKDLWFVEADEGQLGQAVHNLVINASQAMSQGGMINISSENIIVDAKGNLPLREGKYVKITIEDQGKGIREDHLDKIFDPYFTTKQTGSGLGLAVTHSVIRNHDGYIEVKSTPGVGTTFTLYLPAAERKIDENKAEESALSICKGRILLMDDEEIIRTVAGAMLQKLGYDVEFAHNGNEALDYYRKSQASGNGFDAVIMDLTIPGGMGGEEVIRLLREIDPGVKAIVSSGYSNDPVMARFRDYGFSEVIAKPYQIGELGEILQRVIKERPCEGG